MAVRKIDEVNIHKNPATSTDLMDIENYLNVPLVENQEVTNNNADELSKTQTKVAELILANTKTNIKIQNLQTKTDNLEDKVEALIIYGQASGNAINITDSSAGPLKLNIKGNSIQEKVEPYNVLNVNMVHEVGDTATSLGITATYLADGKIQLNGTSTNFVDFYIGGAFEQAISVLTLPKGTYETYLRESSSANVEMFLLYDKTKVLSTTKTNTEFTIEESKNLTGIMVRVWQNVTLNNYIVEPKILKKTEERIVGSNINEFDKGNTNIINALINGTSKVISSFDTCRTLYIPCDKNENYTVSRKAGTRFIVGTTTNVPNVNATCNQIKTDNTAKEITIATTSIDNYLVVFYYNSGSDTLTEQEILNSIKIEKGKKATSYSPYGKGCVEIDVINKNIFIPTLTNNNKAIISARANISLEDDTFVFECTGSDMYLGVITNKDSNYSDNCGRLTSVKDLTSVSVTITNELFTKNFLTCFDKNLVSLGVKQFDSNILNDYALPTGTEYVVLRLGMQNSVSGTTYKTKVQIEGGKASEYMPHEEQNFVIPVQEPMGSASDTFTKVEDVWVERHGSTDIACTQEQINVLNQLENAKSHKNVTHITSPDKAKPNLEVTYIRDLETFIKNLILSEGGN